MPIPTQDNCFFMLRSDDVHDDPRRLSATIAPIPPPPTQCTAESIAEKRSRVSIEDMDTTIDYTWTGHYFLFTSVMQILITLFYCLRVLKYRYCILSMKLRPNAPIFSFCIKIFVHFGVLKRETVEM
jgi:hypothetical protein